MSRLQPYSALMSMLTCSFTCCMMLLSMSCATRCAAAAPSASCSSTTSKYCAADVPASPRCCFSNAVAVSQVMTNASMYVLCIVVASCVLIMPTPSSMLVISTREARNWQQDCRTVCGRFWLQMQWFQLAQHFESSITCKLLACPMGMKLSRPMALQAPVRQRFRC